MAQTRTGSAPNLAGMETHPPEPYHAPGSGSPAFSAHQGMSAISSPRHTGVCRLSSACAAMPSAVKASTRSNLRTDADAEGRRDLIRRWWTLPTAVMVVVALTSPSPGVIAADSLTKGWTPESLSSGQLAKDGWTLVGTTGLSWPTGRQAIVTFWRSPDGAMVRCTDYFERDMIATGGKCERATGD